MMRRNANVARLRNSRWDTLLLAGFGVVELLLGAPYNSSSLYFKHVTESNPKWVDSREK